MATLSEDARMTCEAAPVQIEGRLADGRFFYFRSRFQTATLSVSNESTEAAVKAGLGWADPDVYIVRDLSHLGQYGASALGADEAFDLLREMAAELPDGAR